MEQKGFTLIELLVVLALIAILATILIVVIKPGQIFMKGRDAQRQGDLRNLSTAVDAYLAEAASNPSSFPWPQRGACTGQSNPNIFFSVTITGGTAPAGWPAMPTTPATHTATGTTSTVLDGSNGWVPINFTLAPVINLSQLPLDPRNGQTGTVNNTTTMFAYAFSCSPDFNYEFAAKLEGPTSTMANDGGNQNCDVSGNPERCLYEVGPGRKTLY